MARFWLLKLISINLLNPNDFVHNRLRFFKFDRLKIVTDLHIHRFETDPRKLTDALETKSDKLLQCSINLATLLHVFLENPSLSHFLSNSIDKDN